VDGNDLQAALAERPLGNDRVNQFDRLGRIAGSRSLAGWRCLGFFGHHQSVYGTPGQQMLRVADLNPIDDGSRCPAVDPARLDLPSSGM
jgi:hypothetical protein